MKAEQQSLDNFTHAGLGGLRNYALSKKDEIEIQKQIAVINYVNNSVFMEMEDVEEIKKAAKKIIKIFTKIGE